MICRKSSQMVATTLLIMTVIIFASGCLFIGVLRHVFDVEDDSSISRDHLILGGNILQVVAIGGVIYMLSTASTVTDVTNVGIVLSMFFIFIMIAYLTNFDPNDKSSQWIAIVFIGVDVYLKFTAILLAYGVCSTTDIISDAPKAISQLMGGR